MTAGIVRLALGWACFLVVIGGVLLVIEPTSTPEFVATVFVVGLGLLLAALAVGAALLMRHLAEGQRRGPDATVNVRRNRR